MKITNETAENQPSKPVIVEKNEVKMVPDSFYSGPSNGDSYTLEGEHNAAQELAKYLMSEANENQTGIGEAAQQMALTLHNVPATRDAENGTIRPQMHSETVRRLQTQGAVFFYLPTDDKKDKSTNGLLYACAPKGKK